MDQAQLNRELVPLTDRELKRFAYRVGLFVRRRCSESKAEWLADVLALRDQRRDDRRMCIECKNLQQKGTCFAAGKMTDADPRMSPPRYILQRCNHFEWQTP